MESIPFNRPYLTGEELSNIELAHNNGQLAGDGLFTGKSSSMLEDLTGAKKALLTHSATAALEMAALLADLAPGDEVIMPSWTFVSTANAVVLRGAIPVFVDVSLDTLNLNPSLLDEALSTRTRAVIVVHYAGQASDMGPIKQFCEKYGLVLIEDAAQAFGSSLDGVALGAFGDYGCLSFHETKNIISGEGGALLVNSQKDVLRAEIIREKGTNRSQFFRGEVDKYTWVSSGSSYLPGEIIAAFLYAQLAHSQDITRQRKRVWSTYDAILGNLYSDGLVETYSRHVRGEHNGHLFYLMTESESQRWELILYAKSKGVQLVSHYVPLHSSPFGNRVGRAVGSMSNTDSAGDRLLRLPIWIGIDNQLERVAEVLRAGLRQRISNF